jgi:hypothetical protein
MLALQVARSYARFFPVLCFVFLLGGSSTFADYLTPEERDRDSQEFKGIMFDCGFGAATNLYQAVKNMESDYAAWNPLTLKSITYVWDPAGGDRWTVTLKWGDDTPDMVHDKRCGHSGAPWGHDIPPRPTPPPANGGAIR